MPHTTHNRDHELWPDAEERALVHEAYDRSVDMLKYNSCRHGFVAARGGGANYHAVWGRDGCICAAAAFVSDDEQLVQTGIQTLLTLAEHQGHNGQIPAYLLLDGDDEIAKVVHGGWGNVTAIDANLWFVIACQTAHVDLGEPEFLDRRLLNVYHKTMRHLDSLDADICGLIEVPIGGDWSDLLNRSYHVLYDEVLWYAALLGGADLLRFAGEREKSEELRRRAEIVEHRLNTEFWWDQEGMDRARHRYLIASDLPETPDLPYYQSYLEPFQQNWYHRFDAFANMLACLMGVAPPHRMQQIIQQIEQRDLAQPDPMRVLDPPVREGDEDWIAIYADKQQPYEYHNGAAWPLAGGLWAAMLAVTDRHDRAAQAVADLARSLRLTADGRNNWGFHEFFHGRTGQPMGHPSQAWSAASYLVAYRAVHDHRFACFKRPSVAQ